MCSYILTIQARWWVRSRMLRSCCNPAQQPSPSTQTLLSRPSTDTMSSWLRIARTRVCALIFSGHYKQTTLLKNLFRTRSSDSNLFPSRNWSIPLACLYSFESTCLSIERCQRILGLCRPHSLCGMFVCHSFCESIVDKSVFHPIFFHSSRRQGVKDIEAKKERKKGNEDG